MDKNQMEGMLGMSPTGVLVGLEGIIPASGLTFTYGEGIARVKASNPLGYTEYRIAAGTQVVTALYDRYVYVNGADGVITGVEVLAGVAKPTQASIGANSEWLYKLTLTSSDISGVQDLRKAAGIKRRVLTVEASFEATEVGTTIITPGFRGRILAVDGFIANAIAGTDVGTVTPAISKLRLIAGGTAVTAGALSFAASAAIGVRDFEVPSALNYFDVFDTIESVSAKSTAGGLAVVNYICEEL